MTTFNKPALSLQQQIKKFEQNGLLIDDYKAFTLALKTIGYYRLKGYFIPYKKQSQTITSSHILGTYAFDRKLRLLFLDAIERIEIAIKAMLNDHMSITYSPFWFNNPKVVNQDIVSLIASHYGITDKSNKMIAHYFSKYKFPAYPPSWIIMEVIGMSDISKILSKLHSHDLKPLARFFDHSPRVIQSWVRSLTITRNICAHHGRLWDKIYKITPERTKELTNSIRKSSLAEQIIVAHYLVDKISPEMNFYQQVKELMTLYKDAVIHEQIGFM